MKNTILPISTEIIRHIYDVLHGHKEPEQHSDKIYHLPRYCAAILSLVCKCYAASYSVMDLHRTIISHHIRDEEVFDRNVSREILRSSNSPDKPVVSAQTWKLINNINLLDDFNKLEAQVGTIHSLIWCVLLNVIFVGDDNISIVDVIKCLSPDEMQVLREEISVSDHILDVEAMNYFNQSDLGEISEGLYWCTTLFRQCGEQVFAATTKSMSDQQMADYFQGLGKNKLEIIDSNGHSLQVNKQEGADCRLIRLTIKDAAAMPLLDDNLMQLITNGVAKVMVCEGDLEGVATYLAKIVTNKDGLFSWPESLETVVVKNLENPTELLLALSGYVDKYDDNLAYKAITHMPQLRYCAELTIYNSDVPLYSTYVLNCLNMVENDIEQLNVVKIAGSDLADFISSRENKSLRLGLLANNGSEVERILDLRQYDLSGVKFYCDQQHIRFKTDEVDTKQAQNIGNMLRFMQSIVMTMPNVESALVERPGYTSYWFEYNNVVKLIIKQQGAILIDPDNTATTIAYGRARFFAEGSQSAERIDNRVELVEESICNCMGVQFAMMGPANQ